MFTFSNIEAYHALLLNSSITCSQVVEYYIEKIRAEADLNAFIEIFEDALIRADALDQVFKKTGKLQGRLHGVIAGIKDVISYEGHRMQAGSKMLDGFRPLFNATAVERILAEGAIIIGRQNCDEFAMGSSNENSVYGPAKNGKDKSRVTGGSSGGSAVAIQAGLCMFSLGSDTGGSVRQPAGFCGCFGVKPTYGRVSRHGLVAYASSFDQIGVLTTSPDDAALVLDVIGTPDSYDSTCLQHAAKPLFPLPEPDKKWRIAYFPEALEYASLDKFIRKAIEQTLKELSLAGHQVLPVTFDLMEYIVPTYYILTTAEATSNLNRYDGVRYGYSTKNSPESPQQFYIQNRTEGFGKEVKRRIMLGNFVLSEGYFDAYFTKAQQVRRLLKQKTEEIFSSFDLLLSPVSPSVAFKLGEKSLNPVDMYVADIYTVFANLTGIPAVSIPLYECENGMPFGLQAMAKAENEVFLLQLSKMLMSKLA